MTIPANHVDNSAEYAAVRDGGAGLLDLSDRGRILVGGSEAVMFLNGLVTNDMKTLAADSWMPAVFPNVQGRLIAAIRVIHRSDGFLIDTEGATHETVLKLVERFKLAGDFLVTDLTSQTSSFSVQGAKARGIVQAVVGKTPGNLSGNGVTTIAWQDEPVTIIHATHTGEDGFDLFLSKSNAEALSQAVIVAGACPVGSEVFETLRIEAGIGRYGIDLDETNVVTETNLDEAVSFTKGCYIGQEIIARIKYRGHVAKKLAGLVFDGKTEVNSGARILSIDDKEIGRVTSSTFSPQLRRTIALGYVKYDYLTPGTSVKAVAGDEVDSARVAELPFVRASWNSTANA